MTCHYKANEQNCAGSHQLLQNTRGIGTQILTDKFGYSSENRPTKIGKCVFI